MEDIEINEYHRTDKESPIDMIRSHFKLAYECQMSTGSSSETTYSFDKLAIIFNGSIVEFNASIETPGKRIGTSRTWFQIPADDIDNVIRILQHIKSKMQA